MQFDRVHIQFDDWMQNKRDERVWRRPEKTPHGKQQVPKYKNDAEILAIYYGPGSQGFPVLDPAAAEFTDDELAEIMDELIPPD